MIDADRVRELLKGRDWSQAQLARRIGITPPAIQQILSGKTKSSRHVPQIARALGVSEDYLTGRSNDPFDTVGGTMTPRELAMALRLKLAGNIVVGTADEEEWEADYNNQIFDPAWLTTEIAKFDHDIWEKAQIHEDEGDGGEVIPVVLTIKAATDAMAPTIRKGDEVTVSLLTTEVVESDGIWLFSYGGLPMFRRLMPLPDGRFRVFGDNPIYESFEAPASDIKIRGRAFWVGRSIA